MDLGIDHTWKVNTEEKSQEDQVVTASKPSKPKSEAMLGIVNDTEEESQKDQVVTASGLFQKKWCSVYFANISATKYRNFKSFFSPEN